MSGRNTSLPGLTSEEIRGRILDAVRSRRPIGIDSEVDPALYESFCEEFVALFREREKSMSPTEKEAWDYIGTMDEYLIV
jgi:hypothetical protein